MATPRSGPRRRPALGDLPRQNQADVEQLRRRLSRQPKVPKVEAGGVVGMVQFVSNDASIVALDNEIDTYNVTYGAPETVAGDGSWLTLDGYEVVLEEGYYLAAVRFRIGFPVASAPNQVQVYFGDGVDWMHQNSDKVPLAGNSGGTVKGVEYVMTGGVLRAGAGQRVHAEIQWVPTASVLASFSGPPSILWSITKLA